MEEALSRSHHTWALDVEPADLGFTFLQRRRTYRISVDKRLEMICNPVDLYAAVKAAFAGKMPKVSFGILQGVFATRADLKAAVREALRAKCTCGNAQVCGCTFEGQLADGQRSSLQAFRSMYRAKFISMITPGPGAHGRPAVAGMHAMFSFRQIQGWPCVWEQLLFLYFSRIPTIKCSMGPLWVNSWRRVLLRQELQASMGWPADLAADMTGTFLSALFVKSTQ